ncbi:hypothetical protein FHETE_9253 [Fusarium heterosporum]|uniref:Uncharacterized protein n=1 Tax=Fusarium heterosporum TaxID=42747 RepID=A0A8H5SYG6_FUSHE|nr:hypothetical protein FHETE_9253 [Fusarium heterosporum]
MEQQGLDTPCTPFAATCDTEHRSTRQSPSSSPSTLTLTPAPQHRTSTPSSRPTTPATAGLNTTSSNRGSLSTSEPTLRFPRPQGNRHLANWISSSDPDIMRITTTTEDTGLSESTYELISGTDTESQDGNYTESINESVGSIDEHRPDDVHSLADTEQFNDDESVTDEYEPPTQQPNEEPHDISASVDAEETPQVEQSWASVVKNGPLPEVELEVEPEGEAIDDALSKGEPESESEDEARSRCSLEYTQQSLKTPSIPGPDASNTKDKPSQGPSFDDAGEKVESRRARCNKWLKEVQRPDVWGREFLTEDNHNLILKTVACVFLLLLTAFLAPVIRREATPHNPAATSVVTIHPTLLPSSSTQLSTSQPLSTSTGATALVPLENALPDEWLWGGKQPEVTVTRHEGDFLIHMPQGVKKSWLDRSCLSLHAKRGDEPVLWSITSVDEGMLLKFPKKESHGTVKVDIYTTCRPKVHKVLRITFEKGIISEALDLTWNFAQRIPELVPAAAQEAERRLEGAKRSLETASDNLKTTSDNLYRDIGSRLYNAHRSLYWIKAGIRDRAQVAKQGISTKIETVTSDVRQQMPNIKAIQQQAGLDLLGAQIRARLWWLKLTAGKKEHDRYQHAAEQFLANKLRDNVHLQPKETGLPKTSGLGHLFRLWSSSSRQDNQGGKKA